MFATKPCCSMSIRLLFIMHVCEVICGQKRCVRRWVGVIFLLRVFDEQSQNVSDFTSSFRCRLSTSMELESLPILFSFLQLFKAYTFKEYFAVMSISCFKAYTIPNF